MNAHRRVLLCDWEAHVDSNDPAGLRDWLEPACRASRRRSNERDFLLFPELRDCEARPPALIQFSTSELATIAWFSERSAPQIDRDWLEQVVAEVSARNLCVLLPIDVATACQQSLRAADFTHLSDVRRLERSLIETPATDGQLVSRPAVNSAEAERLFAETQSGSLDFPELRSSRLSELDVRWEEIRVFELDQTPIGLAWIESFPDGVCQLGFVGVVPQKRGCGFGQKVVRSLLAEARRAGHETMCLDVDARNSYAIDIYESCGFFLVGERRLWWRRCERELPTISAQANCEDAAPEPARVSELGGNF